MPAQPNLPQSPFAPVSPLLLTPADSDLQEFLKQAHSLIEYCPFLVAAVDADLDQHGLRKKALRLADERWLAERTSSLLPSKPQPEPKDVKAPALEQGRPRTPGYVVLISMLLRGFFGAGFKARDVTSMMLESITLLVFFQNLGLKMPGRSTLTELVNAVTNKTRMLILDAQVALVLKLGLDDFTVMLQDSTHVDSNTKWPTDSSLIRALVEGLLRVGQSLIHLGLPPVDFEGAHRVLLSITRLDREIGLLSGKKEGGRDRRRRYEKLLKKAKRAQALVTQQMEPIGTALTAFDRPPSRKELAVRAVERIRRDLNSLGQAISACEARVVRNEKVPMSGKVLSISDPDASFIAKGQREPVVGYKPQIARSGAGFITGLLLPKGNAADSDQLLPMVREVMGRTHIDLAVITVDDGYSSAANMQFLKAPDLKIPVVSINGAKGHALTLKANWDSDEYAAARNLRSAVESLIFTLKQGFGFGEVARRSLAAVHAELLEKALAYNLCHMVRRRQVEFAKQRPEQATA